MRAAFRSEAAFRPELAVGLLLMTLADAVCVEAHPLLKRAKDIGSAAVPMSIAAAAMVWLVAVL